MIAAFLFLMYNCSVSHPDSGKKSKNTKAEGKVGMENCANMIQCQSMRFEICERIRKTGYKAGVLAIGAAVVFLAAKYFFVIEETEQIHLEAADTEAVSKADKRVDFENGRRECFVIKQEADISEIGEISSSIEGWTKEEFAGEMLLPEKEELFGEMFLPENVALPEEGLLPGRGELPGESIFPGKEEPFEETFPEKEKNPGGIALPENEGISGGIALPENEETSGGILLPENQNPAEEEDNPDNDHVIESPVENGEQEESEPEENVENPAVLSGFLVDEEGMICGMDAASIVVEDGYLELPSEGCCGIRNGALTETGAGIVEVYLPENLVAVEEGAFANLYHLEWIETAFSNVGCKSVDGVLFDASGTTLLAFPGGRTDVYSVPANVIRVADQAFANTSVSCLDLRACGPIEIGADVFGAHGGNGLEVWVPEEYTEWYQNVFAGYDVVVL